MKAEINNENKAKFFALYWGQMVLSDGIEIGGNVGDCEEEMFLLLKPISSISDEDAKVINLEKYDGIDGIGWYELTQSSYKLHDWNVYETDYLRIKGYALNWMGLSVEEMVEAYWIKLTEK
jgi:hypothetical protein